MTRPTRLERLLTRQARNDARIDVDADDLHRRGHHVHDGDGVEHRAHHEDERDVAQLLAHDALRFERIGDDAGKRAVVANRAGKDDVDAVFDAGVHDPAREEALRDGGGDPAGRADLVDRVHVVFVTGLGQPAPLNADAERGAIENALDVVNGEAVASEKALHETARRSASRGATPAPVWTTDGPATTRILPFSCRIRWHSRASFRMIAVFGVSAETFALNWKMFLSEVSRCAGSHADALMADDDLVALPDIGEFNAARAALVAIDRDRAVHHRGVDGYLAVAELQKRLLIRRDVETVREDAVGR